MKKIKFYLFLFFIVVGLLFFKYAFFPTEKAKAAGIKDEKKTNASPVSVFIVGKSHLEDKLYTSGTILANEAAELKIESGGNIVYINLPEGELVQRGSLLLKVNDAEVSAQFNKVKIELKLACEIERREFKLLNSNSVSQQDYDVVLARLNSLKADSAFYHAQILKTEVRAPFTGKLGLKKVSAGAYVTPSMVIANIYQINPVKIDFSIPEKYYSLFQSGQEISFCVDGSKNNFRAKIKVKDPQIDLLSRSVHYLALSSNPKEELLPGAFARVELLLRDKDSSLFVPTEAILPVLKGKKVFVVKDGLAREKYVETGLRTEDFIQVTSGLSVGDSVITNGNYQLKNGSKLKVQIHKTTEISK